jgi:hypothetical protein
MNILRIQICLLLLILPTPLFSQENGMLDMPLQIPSIPYKIVTSMRTREKRSVRILLIKIAPEDFVRDRMLMLAH